MCFYDCRIYVMMTSAKSEKVLYLAITPDFFKNLFQNSIFLSFRREGGKKTKK